WSEIDESLYDRVIVLSGIHDPRWTLPIALLMRRCGVPARHRLWVQAVTLDHDWSRFQGRMLRKVAKLAVLNPVQGERLRTRIPDLVVATPGVELEAIRATECVEGPVADKVRIG